jgi:hypothetical protein
MPNWVPHSGQHDQMLLLWSHQLHTRLSFPIPSHPNADLSFLEPDWIINVCLTLNERIDLNIKLPEEPTPSIFEQSNGFLMEHFTGQYKMASNLRNLNAYRLWLQVSRLSEIPHVSGTNLLTHSMIINNSNHPTTSI